MDFLHREFCFSLNTDPMSHHRHIKVYAHTCRRVRYMNLYGEMGVGQVSGGSGHQCGHIHAAVIISPLQLM